VKLKQQFLDEVKNKRAFKVSLIMQVKETFTDEKYELCRRKLKTNFIDDGYLYRLYYTSKVKTIPPIAVQ
jgi:hypothetical protein